MRCERCLRDNPANAECCAHFGGPIARRTATSGRLTAQIVGADPALAGTPTSRSGRILLVVSREEPSLYHQLVREFGDKPNIRVIVDRRVSDRRAIDGVRDRERRARDRRVRLHTDSQLRALGWSVIRFDD